MTHPTDSAHPANDRGLMFISSRNNPRIKQIRNLRHRKERERTGLFFIEGIHLVAAAVELNAAIKLLVIAPALLTSPFGRAVVWEQRRNGIPCLEVTPDIFQSLAIKEGAQGIGAVVAQRCEPLRRVRLAANACWVALDTVQYPGNLGTILRTSDAVGGTGVILLGDTTDPYDPASVRASTGALFSQRLIRASFEEFARWKCQHNYVVVGTSPAASTDYQAVSYQLPMVLLMGGEPLGLAGAQQAVCDRMVNIPMVGHSDSLNLSVAASLMLYEIFNQRRAAVKG